MKSEDRTYADPTLLVDTNSGQSGRSVLLVYSDVQPGENSQILDVADGVEILFGRSRKCAVHIDTNAVSREHAKLTRVGNRFRVEDLGSRNGTMVNGETIEGPHTLNSGDEIQVGPTIAVLSIGTSVAVRAQVGTTADLNERLEAECDRSHRYGRSLALVMLRLEGEVSAMDEAVELLAGRMRAMDTLCEYAPDELCVVMPELDIAGATQMAERMAREARSVLGDAPSAVRVGIALSPDHATNPEKLIGCARSALREAQARKKDLAISKPSVMEDDSSIIVHDPKMKRVFGLVDRVATSKITVLIYGETGVGKEIVAASLHNRSERASSPYVRLNCASIPETLLESELFGHEKGAFTGAEQRKIGYFEAAKTGTIFLDEIGEISASVQAKLLRVLESRTVTRVGGTEEIPVDVRIVCATNRDLEVEVREGRFREDLFYRISAFSIVVPPLRERKADILPLCEHFLRESSQSSGLEMPVLSAQARAHLSGYNWPGNVRQLRNAMERAVVLASEGVVNIDDLPDRLRQAVPSRSSGPAVAGDVDVRDQLADLEHAAIEKALEAVDGNQTRAAKALGLSRRALIYKMEKYGLKKLPASRR